MNITHKVLRQMTDSAFFARGEDYFKRGRVKNITRYKNKIIAKVLGNDMYRVQLWEDNHQLQYECSCPIGYEGEFCKHCVAVGLAWLEKSDIKDLGKNQVMVDKLQDWLLQQNKNTLVDFLMEQVLENESLIQKLCLKVAGSQRDKIDLKIYRDLIDQTTNTDEYMNYREVYNYAKGLNEIVGSLEELLEEKHAEAAMELVEYMISKLAEAMLNVDDSNGAVNSILQRLEELHYQTCLKVKPDSQGLARKLFNWELKSECDIFNDPTERYAKLLGKKGLAVYRELAEAKQKKIKASEKVGV